MDHEPGAIDCPLCSAPISRPPVDVIVVCPMCDAVGVPLPGTIEPAALAAVGHRH